MIIVVSPLLIIMVTTPSRKTLLRHAIQNALVKMNAEMLRTIVSRRYVGMMDHAYPHMIDAIGIAMTSVTDRTR